MKYCSELEHDGISVVFPGEWISIYTKEYCD